ncbi:hypothetical protein B0H14DRAFT_2357986, partial [Mycena olivaceomarginata]
RIASIIPVENIRRSVHLFPQFGLSAPRDWTCQNVAEKCNKFMLVRGQIVMRTLLYLEIPLLYVDGIDDNWVRNSGHWCHLARNIESYAQLDG